METKRKALGKGLEQLFANEMLNFDKMEEQIVTTASKGDIKEIPINEIRSNPYQPRKTFDEKALGELAESIKEKGIFQPIIVKKSIRGYELIAGERRTKAAKIAGLETVPAIIRDLNDQEMMEIALIENIQRENLNPIEEAIAYENILKFNGYTQEQLATKFGKSRSHITNMLGLLRLPESVKNYVAEGKISMGHARVLSKIEDSNQINILANKIVEEGLSVRDTEKMSNSALVEKHNKINRTNYNAKYTIYESILKEKTGSKVKISSKKIEIPFDSEKDLERILEILNINMEDE